MIALITNLQSFGLVKDCDVLAGLFQPVTKLQHNVTRRDRYETGIHLEVIGSTLLANCERNIWVPNIEYMSDFDAVVGCSSIIDQVWCKTKHCHEIVTKLGMGDKAVYTGWIAEDLFDAAPKTHDFLHFSNKATYRGAAELIEAWDAREFPYTLTIVGSELKLRDRGNVKVLKQVSEVTRRLLMNSHKFYAGFGYEGFGHSLREAALCNMGIMTVDEPSTRELGQYLIPAVARRKAGQVEIPQVGVEDIAAMVDWMTLYDAPSLRTRALEQNEIAGRTLSALLS